MEAPVRLRYLGYMPPGALGKKFGEKTIYTSYDPGIEADENERIVSLDSTGEKYPSEREVSFRFAARVIKDHPAEFEVLDDPDGSLRRQLEAFVPSIGVAMASKNIQIFQPDGSVSEFPPGSVIQVIPPVAKPVETKPEPKKSVEPPEDKPAVKRLERKDLDKLSKPKIQRRAKEYYDADLDPDEMTKVQMVDVFLELQGD